MFPGCLADDVEVGEIEAAAYEPSAWLEGAGVGCDVGGYDVAVDVGQQQVGLGDVWKPGGVAADEVWRDGVEAGVVAGVGVGVGVYLDAVDVGGAEHAGEDGEDAGAGTHVGDGQSGHVVRQQVFHHEAGGGVVAGAEGHAGVDDDLVAGVGGVGVEGAAHHYLIADDDGLEVVFLPFVVPVLAFYDGVVGLEGDAGGREVGEQCGEGVVVELVLEYVGGENRLFGGE